MEQPLQIKKVEKPVLPEPPTDAADPKALRIEHVGKLLAMAYEGASDLKLKDTEIRKLREDFPDSEVELREYDGIVYIGHMALRERLWEVFGPGAVAEICRERFMRTDSNEIGVDLVLLIRGHFVAEAIGTAKYHPNNPNMGYGDAVESAWSDALRRCCKKFGVGSQVWRPQYIRDWKNNHANRTGGKWQRQNIIVNKPSFSGGGDAAASSGEDIQPTQPEASRPAVTASEQRPLKAAARKTKQSNYSRLIEILKVGGYTGEDFMNVAWKNLWFPERITKLIDVPDPDLAEFIKDDNLTTIMNQLEAYRLSL